MPESFGDARLEELSLLSEMDRLGGRVIKPEWGTAQRDMSEFLVNSGFAVGQKLKWTSGYAQANSGIPVESDIERRIQRIHIDTLTHILSDEQVTLFLTHRGRIRIAELRDALRSNRIRDEFNILWNSRHIDTDLKVALLDAKPDQLIIVAFLDLNGFKPINDLIGHAAGDDAMRIYFESISTALGTAGEAYRKGGDEVVAILRAQKVDDAIKLLSKACRLLMSAILQFEKQIQKKLEKPLSVAIGISVAKSADASTDEMIEQADQEMYRAKASTRDLSPRPSSIAVHGDEVIRNVSLS